MNRNTMRFVARGAALRMAIGLVCMSVGSGALAQAPVQPLPRAVAPDAALEAARAAFETLPEAERRAIQDALVWTGDYSGMLDGGFGRQTFDAVAAYQRRTRLPPNGVLDAKARNDLRNLAQQARDALGFNLIDDPRSGARIGVPERYLPRKDANANGGSRWQSADEKVTLDTRSLPAPEGGLQALYDRNLAIQTPARQITYKVIRPDFFVIAGETPGGKFYSRYAISGGMIRAFSIGYDKALAKDVDRLVVAIANSFVPFPSASAPMAPAPGPMVQVPADGTRRLAGTGLVVSTRQIVTTVNTTTCAGLRVGDARPRQVRTEQGLTIIDTDGDLKATPLRVAPEPVSPGTTLLVLAFRPQGSRAELVATPAVGEEDGRISAPLQPGALGAPVLDGSGALRGIVRGGPDERRMVAGIVPPARYGMEMGGLSALVTSPSRREVGGSGTTASLVAALRDSVVPVTCGP